MTARPAEPDQRGAGAGLPVSIGLATATSPDPVDPRTERHRKLLFVAQRIIKQNVADPDFTLGDLSARMHIAERHLQRIFRSNGTRFRDMVSAAKMHAAKHYLQNSSLSVKEISGRVGYRHPMHFSKAFNCSEGLPPRRWRELHATRCSVGA